MIYHSSGLKPGGYWYTVQCLQGEEKPYENVTGGPANVEDTIQLGCLQEAFGGRTLTLFPLPTLSQCSFYNSGKWIEVESSPVLRQKKNFL